MSSTDKHQLRQELLDAINEKVLKTSGDTFCGYLTVDETLAVFKEYLEQKRRYKNLNFAYACSADRFQKGEQAMLDELIEEVSV